MDIFEYAKFTKLVKEGSGGGDYEIPTFDLTALGLPEVSMDGTPSSLETDTTAIISALEKGQVRFLLVGFGLGEFSLIPCVLSLNGMGWLCTGIFDVGGGALISGTVIVEEGSISVSATDMADTDAVVTNIDFSAFDTTGQIIETYENGETKTTTVLFDHNGNPIQITDGDGNVTQITW